MVSERPLLIANPRQEFLRCPRLETGVAEDRHEASPKYRQRV
jgi:hypothetical protein